MLRTLIRRRFGRIFWPVAGACLVAYFIFYLLHGDRGILSLTRLKRQVRDARADLETTKETEKMLEGRVKLLRPETLDLDMLDERARENLGYAHPDDMVFPLPSADGTSPLSSLSDPSVPAAVAPANQPQPRSED